MNRVAKISATAAAAISLLLFLVNVAIWARSCMRADVILHVGMMKDGSPLSAASPPTMVSRRVMLLASIRGRYRIGLTRASFDRSGAVHDGWMHASAPVSQVETPAPPLKTLGFCWQHVEEPSPIVITQNGVPVENTSLPPRLESWVFWIPCWFIALLTIVHPILWLRARLSPPKPAGNLLNSGQ